MVTDLHYAFRRVKAAPGFAAVAVLTLALGLGTTVAVYSIVDAVMLRPLPYADAERLVDIAVTNGQNVTHRYLTTADWAFWRPHTDVFAALEAYAPRPAILTGTGEPASLAGVAVSGGLMPMLGVRAQHGRVITPDDSRPGGARVVVISDALWRTRFGADPAVVGRALQLDDASYEVVGVMPAAFSFPYAGRQFWMPMPVTGKPGRVSLTARLPPGAGIDALQSRVDTLASGLPASSLPRGWRIRLAPLVARDLHRPYQRALSVLGGAAVLVLLIGCANVANLLLVQGAGRRREVAVRAALGASKAQLVRQFMAETLLLAIAGGALGLLVAQWAIELLTAVVPPTMTFLTEAGIRLDLRALAFAAGVTLVTTLLFGLVPALRNARASEGMLKESALHAVGGPGQERLKRAFVLLQVATALLLLVGAGLLIRTFTRVTNIDPGFDPRNVVTVDLSPSRWKYPNRAAQDRFFTDVITRVRALPGVVATTLTGGVPPAGGGFSFDLQFEIEGRGVVLDDPAVMLPFAEVDGEYFGVLGIPLKLGRTFGRQDTPESPRVVIVGEGMARRLWAGDNPIGTRVRWAKDWPWYTVIGVAGDVYQFRHDQPRGQFAAYYANRQSRGTPAQQTLVVRTAGDVSSMIPLIRQQVWAVDAAQPIHKIETLEQAYGQFFAAPRFYAVLMGVFAFVGLAIAAVGLYAVIAYATAQRTREFGVRLALGASPRDVMRLVLGSGALLTGAGLATGILASLAFAKAMESLLVEVRPTDAGTYVIVTLMLATVALAAIWIPARRATRIDPVQALHQE